MLSHDGELLGSGFFIAPGMVLTAAHVVTSAGAGEQAVFIAGSAAPPLPGHVTWIWPIPSRETAETDVYPLPDLAVIRLDVMPPPEHVCVMLSDDRPSGGVLLAEGYAAGLTTRGPASSPAMVEYEGISSELGGDLIKCKGAVVDRGMSGGPLLDLGTGKVVGVVKAQRSPILPVGLYAVSVANLREHRHDLWGSNQLFHKHERAWRLAIEPGSTVRDPGATTRALLDIAVSTAETRVVNLPPDLDRAGLHQTVWVRRERSERRRWQPLQPISVPTVVRGLPGYGKTWLLAYHAEQVARDSVAALERGDDPERARIPVLMECSGLGARLPDAPDRDSVVAAVAGCLRLEGLEPAAARDCATLTREAFESGRLVICLDGLDEVPRQFHTSLKKALAIIAASQNSLLIATRPSALALDDVLPRRVEMEMLGFGAREASAFVGAWLSHSPDGRDRLEHALAVSAQVRDIAAVPLMLSFLCRLAGTTDATEQFPTSATGLYRQVIDRLLSGRWREPRRSALDFDGTLDPDCRLRVLASALGGLQDSWRAIAVSVNRAQLSAQMFQHPECAYLRTLSAARWEAAQRTNQAQPASPPPDPVLWEFLFDGLLIEEEGGAQPRVRFLHPSLRDFVLALYVAQLDQERLHASLDRHRWFDPDWQDVFARASSLMTEPGAMIRRILDVDEDPWSTQVLFAAHCLVEAGDRVAPDIAERVITTMLDDRQDLHASDVADRVSAFGDLVRAGVGPALARAARILSTDSSEEPDLHREVVCALAERQDADGLRHAAELLSTPDLGSRHRRRLVAALATAGDQAALSAVDQHLTMHGRRAELDAFLSALRPQSQPLLRAAVKLLRARQLTVAARLDVAEALIECGGQAAAAVAEAVRDTTLENQFRCQAIGLLAKAGEGDVTDVAAKLLRSPNITAEDRSHLVETMIRHGAFMWLSAAQEVLLADNLPFKRRLAVARAVRDIGSEGVEFLRAQLSRGLELHRVVVILVALLEVRDPFGMQLAVNVLTDEGAPSGIRGTVLLPLLEADASLVDVAAAVAIGGDRQLRPADRMGVAVALARVGAAEASGVARAVLDTSPDEAEWILQSRLLASAGTVGRATLAAVAAEESYPWDVRVEALIALGTIQTADAREAIASVEIERIPDVARDHLVFGMTSAGSSQYVERVVESLGTVDGAYTSLRRFMYGPNASLGLFDAIRGRIAASTRVEAAAQDSSGMMTMDEALLTSVGLEWNSQAEARRLLSWLREELEQRVGMRLASMMLPRQLDEFETFFQDRDDAEAFRWLSEEFPEYRTVVRHEFAELTEDIRSGRLAPPRPRSILDVMSVVLDAVREMVGFSRAGQWPQLIKFLELNSGLLSSEPAVRLLGLAIGMDNGWPLLPAHLCIAVALRTLTADEIGDLISDQDKLRERAVGMLDQGDFEQAYLTGSLGSLVFPKLAVARFYAALGAAGAGQGHAANLMRSAGALAWTDQVEAGTATIGDVGTRFGWTAEVVQQLRDALRSGHEEASASDAGG